MAGNQFTWSEDVTGVLKNHFISKTLLEQAIAEMVCFQLTTPVPSFGKKAGETVNIYHRKKLTAPTSAELNEDTRIPLDLLELGSRSITVKEIGRGLVITQLAQWLSQFDLQSEAYKALKTQMQEVLDNMAAAAFRSSDVKIKFTPTSTTGGVFATAGVPTATATTNLTKFHMRMIRNYMTSTMVVPPFKGQDYMALLSTQALDGIYDDMEKIALFLNDEDVIYNYEVGRLYGFRIIEVARVEAFPAQAGSAAGVGEAVFFGDEAVAPSGGPDTGIGGDAQLWP